VPHFTFRERTFHCRDETDPRSHPDSRKSFLKERSTFHDPRSTTNRFGNFVTVACYEQTHSVSLVVVLCVRVCVLKHCVFFLLLQIYSKNIIAVFADVPAIFLRICMNNTSHGTDRGPHAVHSVTGVPAAAYLVAC
jgi:hypothetical protein